MSHSDYGRPVAVEEMSNRYFIHPLSGIVERFAIKWRISANMLSFMGLAAGLFGGVFYYYQDYRPFILAAFLSMITWHIFDGADGRVARATGTSSAFGRVIDGICDHLVFGAVYFAFVFYLLRTGHSPTIWFWALAAAASHALQAAGYEERRQNYQRRIKGVSRASVNEKLTAGTTQTSRLAQIYDKAQMLISRPDNQLDNTLEALKAQGQDGLANHTISRTANIVRAWALLNANNRTLMLAVFAVFGAPALYFVYEVVFLNIVLIGLMAYERSAEAKIIRTLPRGIINSVS